MSIQQDLLKAPFPYFGGKRKVASYIWERIGRVSNYVEPFGGSLAVLLGRPTPFSGAETVNDWSCLLINAWRAIQFAPEELAAILVGPAAEVDTESQHWALITRADELRNKLGDPLYYNVILASYWIKGANEWIGSGWAAEGGTGPWSWSPERGWMKRVRGGNAGKGINRQLPHLGDAGKGQYDERIEWVSLWLLSLKDRLCRVRIACGDFERVLSPSATTKLGITGIVLDPPYSDTEYVYGDSTPVSQRVQSWCLESGNNNLLRIVVAGRGTEHDILLTKGWTRKTWTTNRGYSNSDNTGRLEEVLWMSPACIKDESSQ